MEGIIMAAQIILSLSILVGIHEWGHMITAKMFGMRVEQFSIGFPPKIFGIKKGETEYSIGSIPLGGFVKISGMVDESLDTEKLKEEPKPWEFRAKPAWQRLIVMMGGIIMNVVIGILIFVVLLYQFGEPYIPKEEVNKYGIVAFDLGQEIGLQTGDRILQINGHDYESFSDITGANALLESDSYYTVERNGQIIDIPIPGDLIEKLSDREAVQQFIFPRNFAKIMNVDKNKSAYQAGLQEGDIIVEVDGEKAFFHEFNEKIRENAGSEVTLTVRRPLGGNVEEQDSVTQQISVLVAEDSTIGVAYNAAINEKYAYYNFGESIVAGTKKAFTAVYVNAKALGKVFTGDIDPRKSLSGPIGIAQIFGGSWDWINFWSLTALLSMVLAFMNFLPIPALDGGHVMFLMFEIISGRKPSDKFMEGAQKVGMIILLLLMTFVIFNDLWKIIFT